MSERSTDQFDTVELLRRSMEAVEQASLPPALHPAALQIAAQDLRSGRLPATRIAVGNEGKARNASKKATQVRAELSGTDSVLDRLPDEGELFAAIEKETGVAVSDLSDIFHVEEGRLALKVASKALGSNKRAQTQMVTMLLAGAAFAGTAERKLSFKEINRVCDAKHCFDSGNAASNIKATAGFSTLGAGPSQAVVSKSGWQDAFAAAARRVLGKPEQDA